MLGVGSDLRVRARGGEPARGQRGRVGGVNEIVRPARMVRTLTKDAFGERDRLLALRAASTGHLERERRERGGLEVARIARGEMTHRVGERALAHGGRRLGIEGFYRRAVVALPIGARLGETCGGRGPELREDTPCGGRIVLAPEQMRVRERLEPVRESEARIDL